MARAAKAVAFGGAGLSALASAREGHAQGNWGGPNIQPFRLLLRQEIVPSQAQFLACRNTVFSAYPNRTTRVPMLLARMEVIPHRADPSTPPLENFVLTFRGPNSLPLGQDTYVFQHPGIGMFRMFIVPKGSDGKACTYEAVFNRIAAPARPLRTAPRPLPPPAFLRYPNPFFRR